MSVATAPTVSSFSATKPGYQTSEGQLTVVAVFLGVILEAIGSFLSREALNHVGSVGWAVAPVVVGALLQLCSVFGYTKSRTLIKQQALLSGLTAALPLAVQIAEAVADRLAGVSPTVTAAIASSAMAPKAPSSFASSPR